MKIHTLQIISGSLLLISAYHIGNYLGAQVGNSIVHASSRTS
jgi:hypothetical protein